MFDRYSINSAPSSVSIDVVEKRAPTDESVRLLREMEKAARQEVTRSIDLPSNQLTGVLHYANDHLSGSAKVAVIFKLNGETHRVDVTLRDFEDATQDARVGKVMDAVSKRIAANVLSAIFKSPDVVNLLKGQM